MHAVRRIVLLDSRVAATPGAARLYERRVVDAAAVKRLPPARGEHSHDDTLGARVAAHLNRLLPVAAFS